MKNNEILDILEKNHEAIVCEIATSYQSYLDGNGDIDIMNLYIGSDGKIYHESDENKNLVYIGDTCMDHMSEIDKENPFSPYTVSEEVFLDIHERYFYKSAADDYDPFDWDPSYIGRMKEEEGGGC